MSRMLDALKKISEQSDWPQAEAYGVAVEVPQDAMTPERRPFAPDAQSDVGEIEQSIGPAAYRDEALPPSDRGTEPEIVTPPGTQTAASLPGSEAPAVDVSTSAEDASSVAQHVETESITESQTVSPVESPASTPSTSPPAKRRTAGTSARRDVSPQHEQLATHILASLAPGKPQVVSLVWVNASPDAAQVTCDLAAALAERQPVTSLLVEANDDRQLSRMFHAAAEPGLGEILQGGIELSQLASETEIERLAFLSWGQTPPATRLQSPVETELLAPCREMFPLTVVCSRFEVPLAIPVARGSDVTYAIVNLGFTNRREAKIAINRLQMSGVRLGGVILSGGRR